MLERQEESREALTAAIPISVAGGGTFVPNWYILPFFGTWYAFQIFGTLYDKLVHLGTISKNIY